jgi:hypothetical protein
VYGPALPTRDDIAAAAREERDTQLRVYILFAHRWKCNVIVCEINKLYIRISPQYVHIFFPLRQKFETRQKKKEKNIDLSMPLLSILRRLVIIIPNTKKSSQYLKA